MTNLLKGLQRDISAAVDRAIPGTVVELTFDSGYVRIIAKTPDNREVDEVFHLLDESIFCAAEKESLSDVMSDRIVRMLKPDRPIPQNSVSRI